MPYRIRAPEKVEKRHLELRRSGIDTAAVLLGLRGHPNPGPFQANSKPKAPDSIPVHWLFELRMGFTHNPRLVDRIWFWGYYNKIPIYPIFYLLKGDYNPLPLGFRA